MHSWFVIACSIVAGACAAQAIHLSGPLPVHARATFAVSVRETTVPQITITAHHGLPEIIIADVPTLIAAALSNEKSDERDLIRLAIRAIDFDATSPGDAQLARNDGASVLLAHGTGPDTHG